MFTRAPVCVLSVCILELFVQASSLVCVCVFVLYVYELCMCACMCACLRSCVRTCLCAILSQSLLRQHEPFHPSAHISFLWIPPTSAWTLSSLCSHFFSVNSVYSHGSHSVFGIKKIFFFFFRLRTKEVFPSTHPLPFIWHCTASSSSAAPSCCYPRAAYLFRSSLASSSAALCARNSVGANARQLISQTVMAANGGWTPTEASFWADSLPHPLTV